MAQQLECESRVKGREERLNGFADMQMYNN
jgi:hypothetical protein